MILLLWTLASAQELACEPVLVGVLEAHLAEAERALAAMDLAGAGPTLDRAAEAARCLDSPIPRPMLGRLAWARAEVSAGEMDEEVAWTWIRLAQGAGVPGLPDRVPATHPVRRVFAETRDPVPMSGPEGVALHWPKKGQVYADGAPITEPSLRVSTPHLLQIFDKDGAPYLGSWQNGAVFPSSMLVPLVEQGHRQRRTAEAGDELPPPNWKPRKINTEQAYRDWIRKHQKGPWLADAQDGIDDLRWAAAVQTATELVMRQYIHDHPDGLHVDEAEFFIENLQYRAVVEHPSRDAWRSFLETHPDGTYGNEARVQLDEMDWETARRGDTASAYSLYHQEQPDGRHAEIAAQRHEERALDEALEGGLDSALEAFLERWPDGRFTEEAKAILGAAEFDRVSLTIGGEVPPSVSERVQADLRAELEKRQLPVLEPDADPSGAAHLEVVLHVVPEGSITRLRASLELTLGELARPLYTLHLDSQMLPKADAGALFGQMMVANLRSFDRWFEPPAEVSSGIDPPGGVTVP